MTGKPKQISDNPQGVNKGPKTEKKEIRFEDVLLDSPYKKKFNGGPQTL